MDKVFSINKKDGQVGKMYVYHKKELNKQNNVENL